MNAFLAFAQEAIPQPVQRRQARREARLTPQQIFEKKIDKKTGGILIATGLEAKMEQRQRLSRAFLAWRRAVTKEVLASEPRLPGFLKYLRTIKAENGGELVEAVADSWLITAPQPVRILALRMIANRCDYINRLMGNEALDDPMPPETNVYLQCRELLHAGGRG